MITEVTNGSEGAEVVKEIKKGKGMIGISDHPFARFIEVGNC